MFIKKVSPEYLNTHLNINMTSALGITYTEVGDQYICATMPVDERTTQPMGLLHGGASVVLAETLGSVASHLCVSDDYMCVGLEINANHVKSAIDGLVKGKATPLHIGKKTHIWNIEIRNTNEELVCISRLTVAVISKKK